MSLKRSSEDQPPNKKPRSKSNIFANMSWVWVCVCVSVVCIKCAWCLDWNKYIVSSCEMKQIVDHKKLGLELREWSEYLLVMASIDTLEGVREGELCFLCNFYRHFVMKFCFTLSFGWFECVRHSIEVHFCLYGWMCVACVCVCMRVCMYIQVFFSISSHCDFLQ